MAAVKRALRVIDRFLQALGIFPRKTLAALSGLAAYRRDWRQFKAQAAGLDLFAIGPAYPCLDDRKAPGGTASGHYFHQDLLAARRIFAAQPAVHVDVGSRVDGFVAHVAVFRPIRVLDIRPVAASIPNVEFIVADLMGDLREDLVGCCDSLSCLHALEHFGLGRYGDPIDYLGHLKGLRGLVRLLRPGGKFYFSVPIGPQRVEFNGHRVFCVAYLLRILGEAFRVDAFSYVDDKGDLRENVPLTPERVGDDFGCIGGCGIFELTKL